MAFPSSRGRLVGDNQADHDPRRKRAKSPASRQPSVPLMPILHWLTDPNAYRARRGQHAPIGADAA
jgi:hypothetical protein